MHCNSLCLLIAHRMGWGLDDGREFPINLVRPSSLRGVRVRCVGGVPCKVGLHNEHHKQHSSVLRVCISLTQHLSTKVQDRHPSRIQDCDLCEFLSHTTFEQCHTH